MKCIRHIVLRSMSISLTLILLLSCVRAAPLSCRQNRCACECCAEVETADGCCEGTNHEAAPACNDCGSGSHGSDQGSSNQRTCHCSCTLAPPQSLTPFEYTYDEVTTVFGVIQSSTPRLLTFTFEPILPPPISAVLRI